MPSRLLQKEKEIEGAQGKKERKRKLGKIAQEAEEQLPFNVYNSW